MHTTQVCVGEGGWGGVCVGVFVGVGVGVHVHPAIKISSDFHSALTILIQVAHTDQTCVNLGCKHESSCKLLLHVLHAQSMHHAS